MVFQHLCSWICSVFIAQGFCPNSTRNATNYSVFWIHSVTEEERKVWTKLIDVHTTAQVVFYIGKSVGQSKGQLRNRIRSSFGDVITAYRYRIEISHFFIDEIFLNISHQTQRKLR